MSDVADFLGRDVFVEFVQYLARQLITPTDGRETDVLLHYLGPFFQQIAVE